METRECLYHKGQILPSPNLIRANTPPGSPQKISPEERGTIEQIPEAYIWSCCGGNGMVQGCCRAMHTTKKKRKYGKKRDASAAGLDGEDSGADDSVLDSLALHDADLDATSLHAASLHGALDAGLDVAAALHANGLHHDVLDHDAINPNIDASLQDLQPAQMPPQMNLAMAQGHLQLLGAPQGHMQHMPVFHNSLQATPMPGGAQLPPEVQLQIANA